MPSNGQVDLGMDWFCQDVNDGVVLGSFKSMIDGYHDVNPSFLRNGNILGIDTHGTYSMIRFSDMLWQPWLGCSPFRPFFKRYHQAI